MIKRRGAEDLTPRFVFEGVLYMRKEGDIKKLL